MTFVKVKSLWAFLVLVLLAAATLTLQATPVSADDFRFTTHHDRYAGVGEVEVNAGFRLSGGRVYKDWVDCRPTWSTAGTWIEITWCGDWNNGGGNGYGYMDVGANYTIHYTVPTPWGGIEYFTWSDWMRTRVYTNGHVEFLPD